MSRYNHAPVFQNYNGENSFFYQNQRYDRVRRIGEGLTAHVYQFMTIPSVYLLSSMCVSVKAEKPLYRNAFISGPEFEREARFNKEIYHVGEFSGIRDAHIKAHYILMPYFEGILLSQLLTNISFQTTKEAMLWFVRIAFFVMSKMHQGLFCNPKTNNKTGIVHGDIKSNNIILQMHSKEAKIIDFGASAYIGDEIFPYDKEKDKYGRELPPQTSFPHVAPELFVKKTVVEPSQDAYGLGVLLNNMFLCVMNRTVGDCARVKTIADALHHEHPQERLSIDAAIAKLHAAFFADVLPPVPATIISLPGITAHRVVHSQENDNHHHDARDKQGAQLPVATTTVFRFFNCPLPVLYRGNPPGIVHSQPQ